jgi:hypothetical protein
VGMREFRRGVSGEDEQDEAREDHERGKGELSSQRGDTHRPPRED